MKKFLLYIFAFAPLAVSAQVPSGFYRVQNSDTHRYISIIDTYAEFDIGASYPDQVRADLGALPMLSDFEGMVSFNPATICYLKDCGDGVYNLVGQGMDLHGQTGRYLNIKKGNTEGTYQFYAEESRAGLTVKRYLIDNDLLSDVPMLSKSGKDADADWKLQPLDPSTDDQYFGIKPDITVSSDGSNWSTLYAGFPCKPSAESTKAYYISKVDDDFGLAVLAELPNDGVITAQVPALIRCAGANPKDNKMQMLDISTTGVPSNNQLVGNYYCNDQQNKNKHHNVTPYVASTMRMLGLSTDGKLAFVKSDIKYLPANKAYLKVSGTAPDVFRVVTEEEYQEIVTGINEIASPVNNGQKVIYDLQGRRITAPSKGLYIVNGKKVVIK